MNDSQTWIMLTPAGAMQAYGDEKPGAREAALRTLLSQPQAQTAQAWRESSEEAARLYDEALERGWVQLLRRPMQGPDTRLDDFVQHVIASLSGERRAVLASAEGFCLGRAGLSQDEADAISAAAADFSEFAHRQARRGWPGAMRHVSFCSDWTLLVPDVSFVPFWVDGTGYVLAIHGEPLLNNPALVELLWGIQEAGARFRLKA